MFGPLTLVISRARPQVSADRVLGIRLQLIALRRRSAVRQAKGLTQMQDDVDQVP